MLQLEVANFGGAEFEREINFLLVIGIARQTHPLRCPKNSEREVVRLEFDKPPGHVTLGLHES